MGDWWEIGERSVGDWWEIGGRLVEMERRSTEQDAAKVTGVRSEERDAWQRSGRGVAEEWQRSGRGVAEAWQRRGKEWLAPAV